MAKRKKRRTSIRTAAGVAQDKYLARVQALADDPLCVLPDIVGEEPKAIAKIRVGLEKLAAGKKPGFLEKRDKGVLGAVIQSIPLADQETVPRLLDHKVAGKRRFFLQRGHVVRGCMLGVQNHDDALSLLMAYRDLAKAEGLHFFAQPGLVCTGATPAPPQEWVEGIAEAAGGKLAATPDGWCIGPKDEDRVRLRFRDGPVIDVSRSKEQVHRLISSRYAGPMRRHPVEVTLIINDAEVEADRERLAAYRAGVLDERALLSGTKHG